MRHSSYRGFSTIYQINPIKKNKNIKIPKIGSKIFHQLKNKKSSRRNKD